MGHIYQIRNLINDAVYIGSVLHRDPKHRKHRHFTDLRGGYHHNSHLQRAWNKYGENNFVFEILEEVKGDVLPREQWHLNQRKKNFPANLNYNTCWIAGNCQGRKWSKAMRKKLSEAHKGIRPTEEAKTKQKETWARKCKTPYSFTAPDGTLYNDVRNLREFCRKHNLDMTCLRMLHKGDIHQHKEWTKTGTPLSSYQLVSPSGHVFTGTFLKNLCIDAGVLYKSIHRRCIRQGKPHKGWMAKQLT